MVLLMLMSFQCSLSLCLFCRLSFGTAKFTAFLGTPLEWLYGFAFWLGLFAAYTLVFVGLRVSNITTCTAGVGRAVI